MHPIEGLLSNEPLERFDAEGELPRSERSSPRTPSRRAWATCRSIPGGGSCSAADARRRASRGGAPGARSVGDHRARPSDAAARRGAGPRHRYRCAARWGAPQVRLLRRHPSLPDDPTYWPEVAVNDLSLIGGGTTARWTAEVVVGPQSGFPAWTPLSWVARWPIRQSRRCPRALRLCRPTSVPSGLVLTGRRRRGDRYRCPRMPW